MVKNTKDRLIRERGELIDRIIITIIITVCISKLYRVVNYFLTNLLANARWQVKAMYDYTAKNARELTFRAGEVINVTQKNNSGWWQGEIGGRRGVFPADYVQAL
jgi:hypothetical protein